MLSVTLGINGFGPCGRAVFFAALATRMQTTTATTTTATTTTPDVMVVAINDPLRTTACMAHLIAHEAVQHGLSGLVVDVATTPGRTTAADGHDNNKARDADDSDDNNENKHDGDDDGTSVVACHTDSLVLRLRGGRERVVVAVTHVHDCRAVKWGRWRHCIVVECSGVYTTRERCATAHCHGASGAAGVVVAAASADATLIVPAVSDAALLLQQQQSPQQRQRQPSSSSSAAAMVLCAGDAVEAALAPLLHALARAFDVCEVHYTAVHGVRLADDADVMSCSSDGCGGGHDDKSNHYDNDAEARCWRQRRAVACAGGGGALDVIAPYTPSARAYSDNDDNVAWPPSRLPSTLEQAVPTLRGRVTGMCYQVPVRRGCALDVVVHTRSAVTRRQLNDAIVAAAAATASSGDDDGGNDGIGDWLAVPRARVTHSDNNNNNDDGGCGGGYYLSSDCLGEARVLCEVASTQVAAGHHAHRLLLWVDLECNYAARLLAIAAMLAARVVTAA